MNPKSLSKVAVNFFAIVTLASLLIIPLYFAKNLGKVAGVKNQSKYLLVSQIENFPNLSLSQTENIYSVTFAKFGQNQAYIGVFIINNPTDTTQTYEIEKLAGSATPFFGEYPSTKVQEISLPQSTSATISIISEGETQANQIVEFKIKVR